jgi:hypothetical protein
LVIITPAKQLGFPDTEDQSADLVDVGDDDDGLGWKVVKILTYRSRRLTVHHASSSGSALASC